MIGIRGAVLLGALLATAAAHADALAGSGRISGLLGWRLTPNDHFFDSASSKGFAPTAAASGGPVLTGVFAYSVSDSLELGIDLFAGGERLALTSIGPLTSISYGALVGVRFQFPIAIGDQPAAIVPALGIHSGPTLVFVSDDVKGGVEKLTQAYAASAGLTWRFADVWGVTLEYKLMLARGSLPEVGGINAGGNWFGAALTYYLPGSPDRRERGGFGF